ncbi:MAG: translation elongation factor Ts [Aestuariivita sp.]|nr:translation elongation factor Ts [Aestuariivita sp.]
MTIKAAQVKKLREVTSAGMMDAKKALVETDGDMEAAIDWLRAKGLAKAAKKSGRAAVEGLVAVCVKDGKGVAIEVNTETDFVARNSEFQDMVDGIVKCAFHTENVEKLLETDLNGRMIIDIINDKIATIGENMSVRRIDSVSGPQVVSYMHNTIRSGMGKIGVLVALNCSDETFGKQIAMHIAATNPIAISEQDLDQTVIERERQVQLEIARESGKPEQVIQQMINGRMKKFVAESTLLNQSFVLNPDLTVANAAKEIGAEILDFVRYEVGEGLQ